VPHVDDGSLHAYVDGELAGAERDSFLAHLAECAACRTRLEEERALVARASELLARAAPPRRDPASFAQIARPRAPRWRIPAAWAATVTIAFAMGWYAQAGRLAHDLAGTATSSEAPIADAPRAGVANAKDAAALRRAAVRSPTPPPVATAPREDLSPQIAAGAAPPPMPTAAAFRDEAAAWPALDADAARALLGRAPAVLPGRAVRRMARSPTEDGVVLIEQEWKPGIVLRLYERRAMSADRMEATRAPSARARSAPSAEPAPRRENLARYVSSLRIEIAGPLASDSLAQLLDSVE
jgi:putative zinc finger protein